MLGSVLLNTVPNVTRTEPSDKVALLYDTRYLNACNGFADAYDGSVSISFNDAISICNPTLDIAASSAALILVSPSIVFKSPYLVLAALLGLVSLIVSNSTISLKLAIASLILSVFNLNDLVVLS